MKWNTAWSIVLGFCHLICTIMAVVCAVFLYRDGKLLFFGLIVCAYGLSYLIQVLVAFPNVVQILLALFSLQYFSFPYIITNSKKKSIAFSSVAAAIVFQVICVFITTYLWRFTDFVMWPALIYSIAGTIETAAIYHGIFIQPHKFRSVLHVLASVVIFFGSMQCYAEIASLDKSWIILPVLCWRLLFLCEPLAFWVSLHSFVNPFNGFLLSHYPRSSILVFIMHTELFLLIDVTIWLKFSLWKECIATYVMLVGFAVTLVIEVIPSIFKRGNKVKKLN